MCCEIKVNSEPLCLDDYHSAVDLTHAFCRPPSKLYCRNDMIAATGHTFAVWSICCKQIKNKFENSSVEFDQIISIFLSKCWFTYISIVNYQCGSS